MCIRDRSWGDTHLLLRGRSAPPKRKCDRPKNLEVFLVNFQICYLALVIVVVVVVVLIVDFILVIVIFPFVQTPSRNPADTLHIPSRNLPKTIQTPSRHLRDTINTSSRHPQDTLQKPLSHPPASRSFKFGNNQNSDTMKLAAEDLRHGCRGFEAPLQRIWGTAAEDLQRFGFVIILLSSAKLGLGLGWAWL